MARKLKDVTMLHAENKEKRKYFNLRNNKGRILGYAFESAKGELFHRYQTPASVTTLQLRKVKISKISEK